MAESKRTGKKLVQDDDLPFLGLGRLDTFRGDIARTQYQHSPEFLMS